MCNKFRGVLHSGGRVMTMMMMVECVCVCVCVLTHPVLEGVLQVCEGLYVVEFTWIRAVLRPCLNLKPYTTIQ